MIRHLVPLTVGLMAGCAKPLPPPSPPAFGELGTYASAARPFSGCWAVRLADSDPDGTIAQLVIVELDTAIASLAQPHAKPELRAYGRAGVPWPRRGQRPAYLWHVADGQPDTVEIAVGGLSFPRWRLTPAGDSLVGRMYNLWDLGGVETDGGPVSARRVACR